MNRSDSFRRTDFISASSPSAWGLLLPSIASPLARWIIFREVGIGSRECFSDGAFCLQLP